MTEKAIFCAIIGGLGAGGDTVGSVLQAILYLLLKKDPVHSKYFREEIDHALTENSLSSVVSYAKSLKLPYLQAVVGHGVFLPLPRLNSNLIGSQIKESLRLFLAVPWNL